MISSLKEVFESRVHALETEQERQQNDVDGLRKDFVTILRLEEEIIAEKGLPAQLPLVINPPEPIITESLETHAGKFVVCLMFNQQAPSEWSEETSGWRIANHGMQFDNYRQALFCAERLRTRFPDYPIEVVKKP